MYGDVCGLQGPERCCRHRRHEQAGEPGTAVHTGATACVRTSRCMEEICSVSRGRSIIQPRCWVALVPLAEWLAAFELMLFAASVGFSFPVKKNSSRSGPPNVQLQGFIFSDIFMASATRPAFFPFFSNSRILLPERCK